MQVTYRYSIFELISMHCYTMPRMPFVKYLFIGIFAFNMFVSMGSNQSLIPQVLTALMGAVFALVAGLVAMVLVVLITKRARAEQTTMFAEDGVVMKHSDKELKAGWASFLKMHIGDNFIFVKMDTGCHLVIPRRAFADKNAEERCVELIGAKVKHA